MKVEFIITVENNHEVPDNDSCDAIADELEDVLRGWADELPHVSLTDSRWRKTA